MKIHTFTANSAAEAVAQIRSQLGPEAIVLNVRQLPAAGVKRLWQRSRIEVLACLPTDEAKIAERAHGALNEPAESWEQSGEAPSKILSDLPATKQLAIDEIEASSRWRVGRVLEQAGLLPLCAQKIVDALRARHGKNPPESLSKELALTRRVLGDILEERSRGQRAVDVHAFVGAPGVGKTTLLSKWLARTVLVEGRAARVWRLDGRGANTAESLSVYGEILGVPVERRWPAGSLETTEEAQFMDLPGVEWSAPHAVEELRRQLARYSSAQVHLVLNAAYETPLLLAQARAFSALPITAISFTHLDEEPRRGKLWNVILGTNCTTRFLSSGQNVPGDLQEATAASLLERFIPCK